MKNLFKIISFISLFSIFASPASAQVAPRIMQNLHVVVYGDGAVAGEQLPPEQRFDRRLEERLKTDGFDATVINMSKEGLLLVDAFSNLDGVIGKAPDVVVLQLGETDVLRHLSAERFKDNMKEIVSRLRKRGIYVVVMGIRAPDSAGADYSAKIKDVFSGRFGIGQVAPLYPNVFEGISGNEQLTLSDGYHANSRGVDVMVNGIYRMVIDGLRWKQAVLQQQQAQ